MLLKLIGDIVEKHTDPEVFEQSRFYFYSNWFLFSAYLE